MIERQGESLYLDAPVISRQTWSTSSSAMHSALGLRQNGSPASTRTLVADAGDARQVGPPEQSMTGSQRSSAMGSPAPHSDTVGVLTAAARCIGPLSLVRSQRHSASPAARAGRLQRPPRSAASLPATCAVSSLSSVPPNDNHPMSRLGQAIDDLAKTFGSPPSGGGATAGEHADKGSVEGPQRGPRFSAPSRRE